MRRSVWVADAAARWIITLGGLGVLAAVLGICVYLFSVAIPLFRGGSVSPPVAEGSLDNLARATAPTQATALAPATGNEPSRAVASDPVAAGSARLPLAVVVDEYVQAMLTLSPEGEAACIHLETGRVVARLQLTPQGNAPSAHSFDATTGRLALGFRDRTVQLGTLAFQSRAVAEREIRPAWRELPIGASVPVEPTSPEPEPSGSSEVQSGASESEPANLRQPESAQTESVRPESISGTFPLGLLAQRVAQDRFRLIWAEAKLGPPVGLTSRPEPGVSEVQDPASSPPAGVARLDYRLRGGSEFVVALLSDGSALLGEVRTRRPLAGGPPRVELRTSPMQTELPPERGVPERIIFSGDGRDVFFVWADGMTQRYTELLRDGQASFTLVSTTKLGPVEHHEDHAREAQSAAAAGRDVTTLGTLWGGVTLVAGDSAGGITTASVASDPTAPTSDARIIVSERISTGLGRITSLAPSSRDRSLLIGTAQGDLQLRHMTSGKVVVELREAMPGAVRLSLLAPKLDAILAVDDRGNFRVWPVALGHSDVSVRTLVAPIRYEGQLKPSFTYQSSIGQGASEPKLSLVPLIFGTLKGTFVALLFAVPLAVLAAIYTSEFMSPSARRVVKPTIEVMASLPSIVLGFVAAIVVAPLVRDHLSAVVVGLAIVPLAAAIIGNLWQFVPRELARAMTPQRQLVGGALALVAAISLAAVLGPVVERSLFRPTSDDLIVAAGKYEPVPAGQWPAWVGRRETMSPDDERRLRAEGLYFRESKVVRPIDDPNAARPTAADASFRRWLDGSIGTAWPGWLLLLFLPASLLSWAALRALFRPHGRLMEAVLGAEVDLRLQTSPSFAMIRLVSAGILGAVLAIACAFALESAGFDPRDTIFGTYSQRNTLVVGFIMGFAIIPLIYTISEDAMRSVPASLRTASLGAGATPWQTAIRVVLPAAGSGIFSACMIGLGRAVGETMIMLTASGNTPEITGNLFAGFRTLAANIATELADTVPGGSHYRVLFLCGLVLFVLTFIVNTLAELVRQRFRKRLQSL